MSSKRRKTPQRRGSEKPLTPAAKVSAVILIITLIASVLIISWYSNWFESFELLYLKNDGKIVGETVRLTDETVFEVKAAGFTTADKHPDYKVEIYPNKSADFTYKADGRAYRFSNAGKLTPAFEIQKSGSEFTITRCSVADVLKYLHPDSEVVIDAAVTGYPFILEVTSADDNKVNVLFRLSFLFDIKLDPDYIII